MAVITITTDNFEKEIMESERTVLLDFFATWCGPCRMVGPVLEEIAEERKDILVGKIDVDAQSALAAQFSVTSIPTLVIIKDGKITNKAVGARNKREILSML